MSAPNAECPGCRALKARVAELEAELALVRPSVAQLQEQLDKLSARLNQNSTNSSRPPSSDSPSAPPRLPSSPPADRKPGGQPGHKGTTRSLKPTHECQQVVPVFPSACAHCHASLPPDALLKDLPPRRHQVLELPPVLIQTMEYQCHAAGCSRCGTVTWATLPPEVPHGIVGPKLQAFCALLVARHRVSRRGLQELLLEAGGEAIALGTLLDLEARTTAALLVPYQEACTAVWRATVAYVDETPWRQGEEKAWLWSASTRWLSLFRIDRHRSREAFELLLPPRADGTRRTVVCDRYSAYQHLTGDERQVCWSHLLREFVALSQLPGEIKTLGEALLGAAGWLFELWHAYREGAIDRETLQGGMRPVQAQFEELLTQASTSNHWRAGPLGRELLRQWECLWTFVRLEGVEPTNNAAERAVRAGVVWRKNSFGNQGETGRAFVERMLTVVGSLRLQGRKVLAYLEAAIRAAQGGKEAPSLQPEGAG